MRRVDRPGSGHTVYGVRQAAGSDAGEKHYDRTGLVGNAGYGCFGCGTADGQPADPPLAGSGAGEGVRNGILRRYCCPTR